MLIVFIFDSQKDNFLEEMSVLDKTIFLPKTCAQNKGLL